MKTEVTFPAMPLTRREVFVRGFAGALVLAGYGSRTGTVLASPGVPGITYGETPGLTEGPYWVDGQPKRSDVRVDTSTGTASVGMPLYLGLTLSQLSDTTPYTISPLANAQVDIWSASAQGVYSDESVENTTGINYGRGYQISNSRGVVNFITNYPGWYSGRTPHVHVRIRTFDSAGNTTYNYTTQLFFNDAMNTQIFSSVSAYSRATAQDTNNESDGIFTGASANASPEVEAGDYMLLKLANDTTHVVGSFHIIIDLSDTGNADATNGSETGGGMGGGGGGGTPPTGGGGTPPTGGGGGTPPTGGPGGPPPTGGPGGGP